MPLRRCMILQSDFKKEEISGTALSTLKALAHIVDNDIRVVDIPERITETILQTSWKEMLSKRFVNKREFYLNWFLPKVSLVPQAERDLLILHALFDEFLSANLSEVKCIPVSPDGKDLKTIKELIDPKSSIAKLFDDDEGRFPMWITGSNTDGNATNMTKINARLTALGMKNNHLSWNELSDRCFFIEKNPTSVPVRTSFILLLMQQKIQNRYDVDNSTLQRVRTAKFLPILRKPSKFPLKWRGDDYVEGSIISCDESYLDDQRYHTCCSYPIIDESKSFNYSCPELKRVLGLTDKLVPTNVLVCQMLEILRFAEENKEDKYSSNQRSL